MTPAQHALRMQVYDDMNPPRQPSPPAPCYLDAVDQATLDRIERGEQEFFDAIGQWWATRPRASA